MNVLENLLYCDLKGRSAHKDNVDSFLNDMHKISYKDVDQNYDKK